MCNCRRKPASRYTGKRSKLIKGKQTRENLVPVNGDESKQIVAPKKQ